MRLHSFIVPRTPLCISVYTSPAFSSTDTLREMVLSGSPSACASSLMLMLRRPIRWTIFSRSIELSAWAMGWIFSISLFMSRSTCLLPTNSSDRFMRIPLEIGSRRFVTIL